MQLLGPFPCWPEALNTVLVVVLDFYYGHLTFSMFCRFTLSRIMMVFSRQLDEEIRVENHGKEQDTFSISVRLWLHGKFWDLLRVSFRDKCKISYTCISLGYSQDKGNMEGYSRREGGKM